MQPGIGVHSYIIIIFILGIINNNNYCIDDQKEKSTENATTLINSYNEWEENQSPSNGKYFRSTYKQFF